VDRVNAPLTDKELPALRYSVKRGLPYGDENWTADTVKRLGLESTVRPQGRPKKFT
jgi:putative transposase